MSIVQVFTKRKPATPALAALLDGFEQTTADELATAKKDYSGYVETLAKDKKPNAAGLAAAMATLGKTADALNADVATMTQWNALLKAANGIEHKEAELEQKHKDAAARYKAAADGLPALRNEWRTVQGAWRQSMQTRIGRDNFLKDHAELLENTEGAKLCR